MEITGTLKNAKRVERGQDPRAPCLRGQVYGDARRRFYDGEFIITSTVLDEDGDVFTTRNSVYRVESWAEDARSATQNERRANQINALVSYFHAKSNAAGWWVEGGRDLMQDKYVHATKLMLVVTELADDKLPHRKMAEVELADACIRIFDLAGALGYDLGGAVVEKDAFNSVRPDHNPGNRAAANGKAY